MSAPKSNADNSPAHSLPAMPTRKAWHKPALTILAVERTAVFTQTGTDGAGSYTHS